MGFNVTQLVNDVLKVEIVGLTAENVEYDNTTSGLTAENLQTAVDEVVSSKQDNLTALTQADIDNKTEVPRVVTGKFIAENVLPQDSGWINASLHENVTSIIENGRAKYKKIGKQVFIDMFIYNGTAFIGNGIDLFVLPLGYRPTQSLFAPLIVSKTSDFSALTTKTNVLNVAILSTGHVRFVGKKVWSNYGYTQGTTDIHEHYLQLTFSYIID